MPASRGEEDPASRSDLACNRSGAPPALRSRPRHYTLAFIGLTAVALADSTRPAAEQPVPDLSVKIRAVERRFVGGDVPPDLPLPTGSVGGHFIVSGRGSDLQLS